MTASPSTKILSTSTLLTVPRQARARELCKVRARVQACWPYTDRVYIWNSETNEKPRKIAQTETTGTEKQNLLKKKTLTLTEKRKQFKENFIKQTNLRWNLRYRLQTTKTRKSSRKPLRRTNSDREEDDYLFKRNFLESYTRLSPPQIACTWGLWECSVWVHACKPYIGRMYLCGSRKKNIVKQRNRDNWYGRPESLLA